ncbi:DUF2243 domain-containing protein [Micromonospora sp. CPCC 205558]|uniref:DUF2243 domain-containing protein n=1 Tax=Micromonospora sp. CPCC 205558 TaxID=3122403 RepID=UPI002FEEFA2B
MIMPPVAGESRNGHVILLDQHGFPGTRGEQVSRTPRLGAGGFQLFDGLVDHKVLRVHQIRYGVHLVPYDVVWNVAGAVLLLAGVAVLWWARSRRTDAGAR